LGLAKHHSIQNGKHRSNLALAVVTGAKLRLSSYLVASETLSTMRLIIEFSKLLERGFTMVHSVLSNIMEPKVLDDALLLFPYSQLPEKVPTFTRSRCHWRTFLEKILGLASWLH